MKRIAVTVGPIGSRRSSAGLAPPKSTEKRTGEDEIRAATLWSAIIRGEPTTRGRMHEVVLTDGVARLIKSRPARLWQNRAMMQLLNRRPERPLAVALALECRIWSGGGEVDDALLVEVLERAAIIASGRQIRERHVFTVEEREDPRILVRLARSTEGA
jgi:hypothetical protein